MKTRTISSIGLIGIAAVLLYAAETSVYAGNITVTNTNDAGPGSLRQALSDANDGDTIDFAVTGTIGLTSGELVVDKNITISGPGANNLAVDGNTQSRVFYMSSGKTVIISGLTITNGRAPSTSGGGISNEGGALTLNYCAVSGNSAAYGGGVANQAVFDTVTLTVNSSTLAATRQPKKAEASTKFLS